jgi:hypothetical protein
VPTHALEFRQLAKLEPITPCGRRLRLLRMCLAL